MDLLKILTNDKYVFSYLPRILAQHCNYATLLAVYVNQNNQGFVSVLDLYFRSPISVNP